MLTTILDEAVNGWTLTIFGQAASYKEVFVYERLADATAHRARVENAYEYDRLKEVKDYATPL